jgi:hypothetical protein
MLQPVAGYSSGDHQPINEAITGTLQPVAGYFSPICEADTGMFQAVATYSSEQLPADDMQLTFKRTAEDVSVTDLQLPIGDSQSLDEVSTETEGPIVECPEAKVLTDNEIKCPADEQLSGSEQLETSEGSSSSETEAGSTKRRRDAS